MFGSFSSLSKALESIGQIVAPVLDEPTEDADYAPHAEEDQEAEEEGTSFDNAIINFIQKKRELEAAPVPIKEQDVAEPESPNSLVEVALDDSAHAPPPVSAHSSAPTLSLPSPPLPTSQSIHTAKITPNPAPGRQEGPKTAQTYPAVFLSTLELEKRVQSKYRESLEGELGSAQKRLQSLEEECRQWREQAERQSPPPAPSLSSSLPPSLPLSLPSSSPAPPCPTCSHWKEERHALQQQLAQQSALHTSLQQQHAQLEREHHTLGETLERVAQECAHITGQHTQFQEKYAKKTKMLDEALGLVERQAAQLGGWEESERELRGQLAMQRELALHSERENDNLREEVKELRNKLSNSLAVKREGQEQGQGQGEGERQGENAERKGVERKVGEERGEKEEQERKEREEERERLVRERREMEQKVAETERSYQYLLQKLKSSCVVSFEEYRGLEERVRSIGERVGVEPPSSLSSAFPPSPLSLSVSSISTPLKEEEGEGGRSLSSLSSLLTVLERAGERVSSLLASKGQEKRGVEELERALGELKGQLVSKENEARQLNEVIMQMRKHQKSSSLSSSLSSQEISSLKMQIEALERELGERRGREEEAKERERELERVGREHQTLLLDFKLSDQQLEQQRREIDNLNTALSELEREKREASLSYQAALQQHERERAGWKEREGERERLRERVQEMEKERKGEREEMEELKLKFRQREYEIKKERASLSASLSASLAEKESVEKSVISSLLLSYFRKGRSREVLEVIGRVLGWGEGELVAVGLRVNPHLSLFTSLWSTVVGEEKAKELQKQGDNLAELWVNFLLNQSDDKDLNNSTDNANISNYNHINISMTSSNSSVPSSPTAQSNNPPLSPRNTF